MSTPEHLDHCDDGEDWQPSSRVRLADLSLTELVIAYDNAQRKIDANDGRLSTDSSAELDMDQHKQEDIANEIARRIGVYDRLNRVEHAHTIRLQDIERRLRLGSYRHSDYEFFDGYLSIAPLHCWRDELILGLVRPLLRGERPRWIRWQSGAWIFRNLPHIKPGRWRAWYRDRQSDAAGSDRRVAQGAWTMAVVKNESTALTRFEAKLDKLKKREATLSKYRKAMNYSVLVAFAAVGLFHTLGIYLQTGWSCPTSLGV